MDTTSKKRTLGDDFRDYLNGKIENKYYGGVRREFAGISKTKGVAAEKRINNIRDLDTITDENGKVTGFKEKNENNNRLSGSSLPLAGDEIKSAQERALNKRKNDPATVPSYEQYIQRLADTYAVQTVPSKDQIQQYNADSNMLFEGDMQEKYNGADYNTLMNASDKTESYREKQWLKSKAQEVATSSDLQGEKDNLIKQIDELANEIETAKPLEQDKLVKQREELQQKLYNLEVNGIDTKIKNKKSIEDAEEFEKWKNKYEGYTYEELLTAQEQAIDDKEKQRVKDYAYEIGNSEELTAHRDKLKAEYDKLYSEINSYDDKKHDEALKHMMGIENELEVLDGKIKNKKYEEDKQEKYNNVIQNDVKAYTTLQKYYALQKADETEKLLNDTGASIEDIKTSSAGYYNYAKNLSEDEKAQIVSDFENLKNQGYDVGKLYKYFSREEEEKLTDEQNKILTDYAQEHPVLGSAASVGLNLGGGVADAAKYIGTEIDSKFNNGDGYINPENTNVYRAQMVRDTVSEDMGGLGKFLYSTGMSMADFLSTAAISAVPGGQAVGLALLGTSAGVSAANDVIESGGDIDHAVMTGLAAGIAETVFEKVSLEQLKAFKQGDVNSVKDFVKNLINGSFTEGTEEAFTDMANAITDHIINGDMSQLIRQYNEYLASGMSEREAWWKTAVGFGEQTMLDFAGGALSGGVMSGGAMAINLVGAKIDRNKNTRQIGEAAMDSEDFDIDSFINAALNTDKDSKAYKMGQSMMRAKKSGNSKSLYNPVNVGILLKLTDEEYRSGKVKNVNQQTQNKKSVNSAVSANNIENKNSNTSVQPTKQEKVETSAEIKERARKKYTFNNAEEEEEFIKLLSPFGTKNEKGLIANVLVNGKAKRVDGKIKRVMVDGIESSTRNYGEDNNKITLRLTDGTVMSADNIMLHDNKFQQLVNNAAQFETMGARAYVRAYEDYENYAGSKADMTTYSEDFNTMYDVGRTGITYDTFIKSGQFKATFRSIGEQAARQAIFAGNQDVDYRYRHPKNRLLKVDGVKGNVTVADGTEFDMDGNAEVLSLLGSLSEKTGRDIVITNTFKNSGIKGQFNPKTGKVYISSEINSAEILSIALHEAGHSIKISAPNEWRELEKFVVNYLTSQNKNVSRMIEEQMAVYRASGQILTDDTALEEIVCNTLMSLASDEKALQTAIKSTDKSALQKIASAIKKIVAKIKNWLSDRNAISAEAYKPFMNDVNALMTLAEKFEKAAESGRGVKIEQNGGEIKAYDERDRINLTAEQRKNTRPDIDRKDVMFADESEKYSIRLSESDLKDYLKSGNRNNKIKLDQISEGKSIILTNENDIIDYIDKSISGNKKEEIKAYGKVNKQLISEILKETKDRIDVSNYFLELPSDNLFHAYREHSHAKRKNNIPLNKEDFEKIPEYFDKHDELLYVRKYASGVTNVCVSKNLPGGKILIIETISKSRGALQFKNALGVNAEGYIDFLTSHGLKNKISSPSSRGSNNSNTMSLPNGTAYNTTVSQNKVSVNNNSMQENENNTSGIKYAIDDEADEKYLEAVENNDLETAQKLVDEAAKKAGYDSPVLYHGTKLFGFTEFDLDKMDDGRSIFLTDSKEIASTYSGIERISKISDRNEVDVDKLTSPETVELLNKYIERNDWIYYSGNEVEKLKADNNSRYGRRLNRDNISGDIIVAQRKKTPIFYTFSIDTAKKLLKEEIGGGNYSLYAKLDNPYVVECDGAYYNDITYYEDLPDELKKFYPDGLWRRGNTREAAEYAKDNGYDSVIFKNIKDNGGRNSNVPHNTIANVYVVFNPNNVKSADPITYDENGNVIPLSGRFEGDKSDIRYAIDDDCGMFDDLFEGETEEQKAERWHEEFENYLKYNPEQALMMTYNASAKTAEQAIKVTDVVPEDKRVDRAIKKVWEKYSINANSEKLAFGDFKKSLNEYVADVRESKISYGESFENLVMACKESLQFSALEDHSFDDFRTELKEICKNGLVLNEYEESEIKEIYGSVANYRKSLFGKCTVRLERNVKSVSGNKTGQYIDDIITELQNKFGEMIPVDMHSLEGLQWFEQIVNKYWQPQYINPYIDSYSEDINAAAIQMAYDMSNAYIAEMSRQIVSNKKADKQQLREITRLARISKDEIQQLAKTKEIAVKESYRKKLADEKERYDKKIKRLNDNLKNERMQGLKRAARTEQQIFKLRKQRTQLEEQNKKQRTIIANEFTSIRDNYLEKKRATILRNRLGRMLNSMSKRLDGKANNNEYIPESLKQPILDVLSSFAVDPGKTKYGKQKAVPGYYGEYRRINEIGSAVTELEQKYSALKKDKTNESDRSKKQQYAFIDIEELPYDSKVNNTLNKLSELLKGKNVYQLDVYDLEAVVDAMELLDQTLKDAVTVIIDGRKRQIQEVAAQGIEEVETASNGNLRVLAAPFIRETLNPVSFGKYLAGYRNGAVTSIFEGLHIGEVKTIRVMQKAYQPIDDVMSKYNQNHKISKALLNPLKHEYENPVYDLQTKDVKEFNFIDVNRHNKGYKQRVRISQGMLISIYLTNKRVEGHRHIINNKWNRYTVVPDLDYNNSLLQNSLDKLGILKTKEKINFKDKNHRIVITENDLEKIARYIESNPMLKEIADTVHHVLNKVLPEEINAVSMEQYGRLIAVTENYYPIKVDESDRKGIEGKDFKSEFMDNRISNKSFVKHTQHSESAIVIDDVLKVFSKHVKDTAEWCGLLIPVENFKKVYNSSNGEFTLRQTIEDKFGKNATHYINKLMGDLQKRVDSIDENFITHFAGNYMGAALLANPFAALKQLGAFPLANKYFGAKNVSLAATKITNGKLIDNLCETYSKYTPYMWYREKGNGTVVGETSRQAGFVNRLSDWMDCMGKMDRKVVNVLLYAAELHVEQTTDLKRGTDEFYKEVARQFEHCIDESQPNSMVTSKPEFIRNNAFKVLTLNAFRSQTAAVSNGIIDSGLEFIAMRDYYKNNKTAENKKAKRAAAIRFLQHLVGAVESAAIEGILSVLGQLLIWHNWDKFRDEKGNISPDKMGAYFVEQSLDSFFGVFAWGGEMYDFIKSMITKDTYYGMEVMSIENLNDIANAFKKGDFVSAFIAMGNLSGAPASNLKRLWNSGYQYVMDISDFLAGRDVLASDDPNFYPHYIVTALQKGDKDKAEYYEDMLKEHLMNDKGKSEKEAVDTIKGKIVSILSDTDEVGEIAKFKYNGELEKYESHLDKVVKQGFDSVDVKKAVDKAINNVKTDMKENGINDEESAIDWLMNQGFNEQAAKRIWKATDDSNDSNSQTDSSAFDETSEIDESTKYAYDDLWNALLEGDDELYNEIYKGITTADGKLTDKNLIAKKQKAAVNAMKNASRTDKLWAEYIEAVRGSNPARVKELRNIFVKIYGSWDKAMEALNKYKKKQK